MTGRNKKFSGILVLVLLMPFAFLTGNLNAQDARFSVAKEDFRKGIVYFNNGSYLAAAEFFRKSVTAYPDYHAAREYLARSYRLAGYTEESLYEWEKLYEVSENPAVLNRIEQLRWNSSREFSRSDAPWMSCNLINEKSSFFSGRFHFDYPVDIVSDDDNNVYVTSFADGKIIKFDSEFSGITTKSFGSSSSLYGIDCRGENIAVSDFAQNQIHILNRNLTMVKSFGSNGSKEGEFHGPQGLCFDETGYIYVVDSGNSRIQKFSPDGSYILQFGTKGPYEGELDNPTDVAIMGDHVYVTDTNNRRIACFDKYGNFEQNITINKLVEPRGISIAGNYLMISDVNKGLQFYNPENDHLFHFKSWNNDSDRFSRLFGACVDRNDNIYCVDHNREKLYIFAPLGNIYSNLDLEIKSIDTSRFPKIGIELSVRTRDSRSLFALDRQHFSIIEDGAKIHALNSTYFRERNKSASLVFCIDRSKDMKKWQREMVWAADHLLKKMHRDDELKINNFSNNIVIGNNFDWSRLRALRALQEEHYENGRFTDRAIYAALNDLIRKESRRAVIVFTDGVVGQDDFKQYGIDVIRNMALAHYIPLFFICFDTIDPELQKLAKDTGGEAFKVGEADKLTRLYDNIVGMEEYRYFLVYSTYKTASFSGWWSELNIEVEDRGQTGAEWGGYFVP